MNEMINWARNEIKLACINRIKQDFEFSFGEGKVPDVRRTYDQLSCYQSALDAYELMMNAEKSGSSFTMATIILNTLIDWKPLTPLQGTDDEWEKLGEDRYVSDHVNTCYRNKRYISLFKYVYDDGHVEYEDIKRVQCIKKYDDCTFSSKYYMSYIAKLVNKMYPIEFPYMPEKRAYVAVLKEYLYDPKNGDYDTIHFIELRKPDGTDDAIGRFFAEDDEVGMREIDWQEFTKRMKTHYERIEREDVSGDEDEDIEEKSEEEQVKVVVRSFIDLVNATKGEDKNDSD